MASKYEKYNDVIAELAVTIKEHKYIAEAIKEAHPHESANGLRFYISEYLKGKSLFVEPKQVSVTEILQAKKEKDHKRVVVNNEKQLVERVEYLESELRALQTIKEYEPDEVAITAQSKTKSEATVITQWSDWHVDEVVDKRTVNGMNEYNPDIAKARATKLFYNTVKLTDTQRHDISIKNIVLQLGGDFIGGFIHPELEQTNSMTPIEGILFSMDLITSGIDFLLNHGKFNLITIICNVGNHGRMTKKMQYANGMGMNLETFMYKTLAQRYAGEKKIKFIVPESEIAYLSVYDKPLRYYHGHQVKYMGGVGGLTVPLYKQLFRWNANHPAFYNFMCDKHTYSTPTPDCQVNGSLKGFDAFAGGHGFLFQEPLQSFTLLDSARGVTIKSKIFCE